MTTKDYQKDQIIFTEGQSLDSIMVIASGSVLCQFAGGEFILRKGDVIGLCDIAYDSHFFTYVTLEATSLVPVPAKDAATIQSISKTYPDIARMMYTSMSNQVFSFFSSYAKAKEGAKNLYKFIKLYYDRYLAICNKNKAVSRSLPLLEELSELSIEDDVDDWVLPFYLSIKELPVDVKATLSTRPGFTNGLLFRASMDLHSALSACEQINDYRNDNSMLLFQESHLDLYDLFATLYFKLPIGSDDANTVKSAMDEMCAFARNQKNIPEDALQARVDEFLAKADRFQASSDDAKEAEANSCLMNSLDTILSYSEVDAEIATKFKQLIEAYKKVPDKTSSDEAVRKIRHEITTLFYKIYEEAFPVSLYDKNVPTVVKMFFNFGYVDEELAGYENANYLFSLAENFNSVPEKGIYTIYEWLRAIFQGVKEPSRNEFDSDFTAYLHELRIQGKIDAAQESRMAEDPAQRVRFEMENMFPVVNKVTCGRISSFCPVFSEHDIIKPLPNCIVTADEIAECIRRIEEVDYSAFYRETMYVNTTCGISKEAIHVRITPDFILMPNIGMRGIMWQEIEGKKRTTPARFMISAFHIEDLPTTITRLTGEYRWEMCKRIQGGRWNDVSDRSLTSEYCDYVQFFKKNSELSADAKEKIKNSLVKAKNSYREMFVRDYITWILFESQGSPRLNKIARTILASYCPFKKDLRAKVGANPMFREIIEKYEIRTQQKLHHLDNVITKLRGAGQTVPEELLNERNYLEGSV